MASEAKRRLERIEKTRPAVDNEITAIRHVIVEPGPNGPVETGTVLTSYRQPDGSFGPLIEETNGEASRP